MVTQKPKKARIIEAAVDIFAQKGFHETTMKEIARAAGVGKGTLYIHFKNKDDLFSKVLDSGIEELAWFVKNRIQDLESPPEKLKKAIKAQLQYFKENEQFCVFAFREVWAYREDLKDQIEKLHNKHTVIIKDIISEGNKKGHFKMSNGNSAAAIVGMVWGAALNSFLFKEEFKVDKIYEDIVTIIFENPV